MTDCCDVVDHRIGELSIGANKPILFQANVIVFTGGNMLFVIKGRTMGDTHRQLGFAFG